MEPEERAALEAELADLKRKLKRREGQAGYGANVIAIRARIAEIEAALGDPPS